MVRQCVKCKRLFEDILNKYDLCPNCRDEEEVVLRKVKDYLWSNPGSTEAKLGELFGVTHEQIVNWLRDGRIEVTPASTIKLTCVRCGSMILTGKYCKDCNTKIMSDMNELQQSLNPHPEKKFFSMVHDHSMDGVVKMHFLQNVRDRTED